MNLFVILFTSVIIVDYAGIGILRAIKYPLLTTLLLTIYVLSKYKVGELFTYRQIKLYLFFIFLTFLAFFHGLVKTYALNPIKAEIGYFLLILTGYFILSDIKKLKVFLYGFIGMFVVLVIMNVHKFSEGERAGYYIAGVFMGDGNDFAWGVNTIIPLCVYLLIEAKSKILKIVLLGALFVLVIGVIGSQSRGGTLGLLAGFGYYWYVASRKKMQSLAFIGVIALVALMFAPAQYFSRMETIGSYEQDSSAMGRIHAWTRATEMALDHPILGVGAGSFNSAYGRFYRRADDPVRWISTHSVYFKLLAEYGFPGLVVYLSIIYANFKLNRKTKKMITDYGSDPPVPTLLPDAANMSLIAYSVCAAFLSGVDYPHLFIITTVTLCIYKITKERMEKASEKDPKSELGLNNTYINKAQ